MRGRSKWNKLERKRGGVLKLLMRLGGSARWKDLEKYRGRPPQPSLQKPSDLESTYYLRMGQTTLKNVLDMMLTSEHGAAPRLRKEARVSKHGPEVWYILTKEGKGDIVNSIIAGNRETLMILRDMFAAMDPVEALVVLEDLKRSVMELVTFIENPHALLPKNAELVASTETTAERKRREAWYRKTGGKVNVQTPRPRPPRKERRREVRNDE